MKQDDKQLLIKDLCARLPYGVKVKSLIDGKPVTLTGFDSTPIPHFYDENDAEWDIEDIRPYLLPMSSMTEGQENEIYETLGFDVEEELEFDQFIKYLDWLNEHQFDYVGLIDKGLAINATNIRIYE